MVNYFTLMQLPEQFAIDDQQLQARLHHLQRQFHPDNLVTSDSEQYFASPSSLANLNAEQRSAVINEAYRTLASPDSRAKHLLALQGIEQPITDSIRDLEFLEQAMSYRMALEDAASLNEITLLKDKVIAWLNQYTHEFEQVYHTLVNPNARENQATDSEQAVQIQTTALQLLQKIQFLVKLSNDIDKQYDEIANQHFNANDDDLYV